jgi:5-methyltetrahydrofolate--homocysteine methyltransferase
MEESMADLDALKALVITGDEQAVTVCAGLIAEGLSARQILDGALSPAMDEVGRRMKAGQCFIPEVLLSARTMQACIDAVRPFLEEGDAPEIGRVVIGTVEGDMHDIGKNLVAMLLSSAGFTVINIGKGIAPDAFVAAVSEHQPDILGMSALLTTTMPKMATTIQALEEAGLRAGLKIMVGGAPVTNEFAAEIGADACGANASMAVDIAKDLANAGVSA